MTRCIGCGAILQREDSSLEGYVKDLSMGLCERCFRIKNYNEYKYVLLSDDYSKDMIRRIEDSRDLVIVVTDFLNLYCFKKISINNPVILVITKEDVIPRGMHEGGLFKYVNKELNVVGKCVVGSKNNYNLDKLFGMINKYKISKNVYVIGYTNCGKSTLVNKLSKNYGDGISSITTSNLPSTTLDMIETVINDDLVIIDTPGLLDKGSIIDRVDKTMLNKILPKKEIKPITFQVKGIQTITIENIFKLVCRDINFTIYMSNGLKVERHYKKVDSPDLEVTDLVIEKGDILVIKGLGFIRFSGSGNVKLYLLSGVEKEVINGI